MDETIKHINQYDITDFGAVGNGTTLNTNAVQTAINTAAIKGGVVRIPAGKFLCGAVFFAPATHLHLDENAILIGSDNIDHYPIQPSRIEGVSQNYHTALINIKNVDGFSLTGSGTIDGNGLKFWQAFWQRRNENPDCTNLEVGRPRLLFIWQSNYVSIEGVRLINAGFWTLHFYRCHYLQVLNCQIFSPRVPVRAPSTDAIDLDVCSHVLIKGCDISVNDDAVSLKGGKGINADKDPDNGLVENVIIEDCRFGWAHAVLTLGSEAIHCRDITLRNCRVNGPWILLRYKLRPDTPQIFENVLVENICGDVDTVLHIKTWTQFFDPGDAVTLPGSLINNIALRNLDLSCRMFAEILTNREDHIDHLCLEDLSIRAENTQINEALIKNVCRKNLNFTVASYRGTQGKIDEL